MQSLQDISAELVLLQEGVVYTQKNTQSSESIAPAILERLQPIFEKDSFLGLLHLGILEFSDPLSESFCKYLEVCNFMIRQISYPHVRLSKQKFH